MKRTTFSDRVWQNRASRARVRFLKKSPSMTPRLVLWGVATALFVAPFVAERSVDETVTIVAEDPAYGSVPATPQQVEEFTEEGAPKCQNSYDEACGTFRYDPQPEENSPIVVAIRFSPAKPKVGEE